MMQESPYSSSVSVVSGHGSAQGTVQLPPVRGFESAKLVEVQELRSRHRELVHLMAGARRENDMLRAQVERSAVLDAAGQASDISQKLRKHADMVRRLHEDMRAIRVDERRIDRLLNKKVNCSVLQAYIHTGSESWGVNRHTTRYTGPCCPAEC